jgi:signal transduction histidine kinase
LVLIVEDDGRGFGIETDLVDSRRHLGLVGMRERAAMFGGTLTARPRADHGFEVTAVLPYSEGR